MRAAVSVLAVFFLTALFFGCGKSAEESLAEADGLLASMESQGGTDPSLAKKAEECYGRALKKDPKNSRAAYGRGMARARNRDFRSALEDFDRAVNLDPQNPEAYYRRALCRIATAPKDKSAALSDLTRTLELAPSHTGAARMMRLLSAA